MPTNLKSILANQQQQQQEQQKLQHQQRKLKETCERGTQRIIREDFQLQITFALSSVDPIRERKITATERIRDRDLTFEHISLSNYVTLDYLYVFLTLKLFYSFKVLNITHIFRI